MSEGFDLIVRGGRIVTPSGIDQADLGVKDGRIVLIAPDIPGETAAELAAYDSYVFPGIIDAHVHFNEPGRAEWEGLATGSVALAAGGGTAFFDMPLNSEPPALDAARLREKRVVAERKSCVDFGLWGGLVPGNLDRLAGLRDAGAIGLKAFLCDSGIASFPRVDADSLRAGMERAAKLGMIVAVHAEDQALLEKYAAMGPRRGASPVRAFLDSRPPEVELAAIRMALELAGETRCALHVVHVSCPEGIALIAEAKMQGVDVTAETCPHYLLLNEREVAKLGGLAKCAPPLRPEAMRQGLWAELRAGAIATIGSDHSPAPPELKLGKDFSALWGGIAGCQHGFELLLSEVSASAGRDLPMFAAVLARNVARRFRLEHRKGLLAEGKDADFTLLNYGPAHTIETDELWTRHLLSPYVGRRSRARLTHTYVRGQAVWAEGRPVSPPPPGRFLRPDL